MSTDTLATDDTPVTPALNGLRVAEHGWGIAGRYCGKLFADLGAHVTRIAIGEPDPLEDVHLEPGAAASRGLYGQYLDAGKSRVGVEMLRQHPPDLLILCEERARDTPLPVPRVATLELAWLGADGPYSQWTGSDLIVQALAGQIHPAGPVQGPPRFLGAHQSALTGGTAAYCAGLAALLAGRSEPPGHYEVSILEAVLILSELQICHSELRGEALPRLGINRFLPTCPLSIHRCKEGWIGVTPITPAQWQAFCQILELPALADDPDLQAPRNRYPHAARIEAALDTRFPERTALEWAELGRRHRVPMVVVPDAAGILDHPIFVARRSLSFLRQGERSWQVPRTPLRLERTPPRIDLDARAKPEAASPDSPGSGKAPDTPLGGVRVVDFSMGWAGPLATRMLVDLGAEVIKVEAGRYPDWWRSVDWSPEAIARKQYEESRHFSALNRAKKSVSIDLTREEGRTLAMRLVEAADVVVENQAAGVMERLGLGYDALSARRPGLVMLSMSAFGSGNEWSDTRAYGSVLEQGSGLPSFCGLPGEPPVMAHIAYGDPIGGLYGAAALLTALLHRQGSEQGQWINNTQIEAMLPFTTPALLVRQATGREPSRLGNRHPAMVPHGTFPAKGPDAWIAVALPDDALWPALASLLGRPDWRDDRHLLDRENRREIEAEIESAIAGWTETLDAREAVGCLQAAGIAAAPVHRTDEVTRDLHLRARQFFYDVERPHVGRQAQSGLPFRRNGRRFPMRGLAPLLGGESATVLRDVAGVSEAEIARLEREGVISYAPTALRAGAG